MIRSIIFFLFLLMPFSASAEKVDIDLSENFIAVSAGFNGAKRIIFGSMRSPSDVAVVIEGPPTSVKLREKKREMGIWINGESLEVSPVPSFYAIIASSPIEQIASAKMIEKHGLSLAALKKPKNEKTNITDSEFEALKSVKKSQGLFQEKTEGVKILSKNLFRADFELPSSISIGNYTARVHLLRGGEVVATRNMPFSIAHVGIEASISNLAHSSPFSYALLALALSLTVGGGAAFVFRRMA